MIHREVAHNPCFSVIFIESWYFSNSRQIQHITLRSGPYSLQEKGLLLLVLFNNQHLYATLVYSKCFAHNAHSDVIDKTTPTLLVCTTGKLPPPPQVLSATESVLPDVGILRFNSPVCHDACIQVPGKTGVCFFLTKWDSQPSHFGILVCGKGTNSSLSQSHAAVLANATLAGGFPNLKVMCHMN